MRFQAYTVEHLVILALFVTGGLLVARWGRRVAGTEAEVPARKAFAVAVGAVGLLMQTYQLTPGDFDLDTSLPFQLCDLATVAAVVALWSRSPRASALLYYVGLSLTLQGVLTPSLAETFPHPRYFGFWALHFGVVWAAVFLTWGLRVRPTWAGYRFTVLVVAVWALAAYLFNVVAETNYGYLNRKPGSASALDLLGPWPVYVLAEIAILVVVWALMTWPWTRTGDEARDRVRSPGRRT